jgi:hypothetical protein
LPCKSKLYNNRKLKKFRKFLKFIKILFPDSEKILGRLPFDIKFPDQVGHGENEKAALAGGRYGGEIGVGAITHIIPYECGKPYAFVPDKIAFMFYGPVLHVEA